jgi:hypothetical protein
LVELVYSVLQVPCLLQYSKDPQRQSFETYVEFFLSENHTSEVTLCDGNVSNDGKIIAADIWRVLILNRLVTSDSDGQRIICHDGPASSWCVLVYIELVLVFLYGITASYSIPLEFMLIEVTSGIS